MAAQGFNNHGVTNGTTQVTMVAAPLTGAKRTVNLVTVTNTDDVATHEVDVILNDGGTRRVLHRELNMAVNTSFVFPSVGQVILQDTSESLEIVLSAAANATQMDWTVHYDEEEGG